MVILKTVNFDDYLQQLQLASPQHVPEVRHLHAPLQVAHLQEQQPSKPGQQRAGHCAHGQQCSYSNAPTLKTETNPKTQQHTQRIVKSPKNWNEPTLVYRLKPHFS